MKNVSPKQCLACSHLDSKRYLHQHLIALYECDMCHSLTAWPRPTCEEQNARHNNLRYYEHPYFERRRSGNKSIERRCHAVLASIEKAIQPQALRGGYHLDVGCDTGSFLLTAAKLWGTLPVGIDVAERSIAEACQRNLEAYCGALESLPDRFTKLSVVTAIDVLEHIVDPLAFLVEIRRRLQPGGVCYLETPNITSQVYRVGRALSIASLGKLKWIGTRLFPREHIQYFSCKGLSLLARRANLEIVSLFTRKLPSEDIGTSALIRSAISAIQVLDDLHGEQLLICAVLRRASA